MRRLLYLGILLVVACTTPNYPGVDNPTQGGKYDNNIVAYIDERLTNEYYWLDEVKQKSSTFNRTLPWEEYLDNSLAKLSTNIDDGYYNSQGQRAFYSYIRDISSTTRATTTGFGISLHYTIAIINNEGNYGFFIENVYPDSPAEKAGIMRGDVITMVSNTPLTPSNFAERFNAIESSSVASLNLTLYRQCDAESFSVTLSKGQFTPTTVVYSDIIDVNGYDKRIGYLVYTGFESEYDEQLIEEIEQLAAEGAEEFILDLRCNGGGAVNSASKLCAALLPARFENGLLCSIVRNKNNTKSNKITEIVLQNTGQILNLERLTVIGSGYTASASELVVMGLRGLDFPVRLIGSTTEGKNCGMDVTRLTIGSTTVEYAPITFMCLDAKGFGGWGDGIIPDIDLTSQSNGMGVSDKNYPLPRTTWGDASYDIALATALADITGKSISKSSTRAVEQMMEVVATHSITKPISGIRNYVEE